MNRYIYYFVFVISALIFSQEYQDVIYLKDGSIIKGMIVENKPGEYIKIKSGENIFVFKIEEIETMKKEVSEFNSITKNSKNIRHGFLIGLGAGFNSGTYTIDSYYGDYDVEYSGFETDFKIGYAPSNNIEIYYTNKRSWFEENGEDLFTQLTGIGVSYFTNKKLRNNNKWLSSPFVSFTYGRGYLGNQEMEFDPYDGNGFSLGLGYEFSPHSRIEINYISTKVNPSSSYYYYYNDIDIIVSEFKITYNYMYF